MLSTEMTISLLVIIGSISSIGFGIWHLFVPKIWHWYSYIAKEATELVIAVRAINVFFSISLILFGLMNCALIIGNRSNKYSMVIVIGSTTILWLIRVIMQILFPQGSMNGKLQYGMLIAFIAIFLCYAFALGLIIKRQ